MKVSKSSSTQGPWLDKKIVVTGDKIKIVTEANEQPTPQGDRMQLVCKVLVKGKSKEPVNTGLNKPSKNALIDAFGDETSGWVDKIVTAHVEKTVVGGKRGIAIYMIPDGMILKESEDGFVYIGHQDSPSGTIRKPQETAPAEDYPDENINIDDIPF